MSMDVEPKEKAYQGFIAFTKWSTLAVVIGVAIVVVGFIA